MIAAERILKSLEWLVTDCKWHADQTDNTAFNSEKEVTQNVYSKELTEAIGLVEELRIYQNSALLSQSTIGELSILAGMLCGDPRFSRRGKILMEILKEDGIKLTM